ncbi:MAG: hypothetical protein ACAI44_36020 [Candidatus Sericytochromatia bacterium]
MRIYQLPTASPPPSLRNIGIRVQTISPSAAAGPAASPAEASPTEAGPASPEARLDQQDRLTLAGLQPQQFQQAYLLRPGSSAPPLVIDPGKINATRLLASLQQIGQRLDLNSALELHGAASELIAAIRQTQAPNAELNGALAGEPALKLVLTGAFGEIEIDLDRLAPDALRAALSSGLEEQPADQLQQVHAQLAGLTERVRAGFGSQEEASQLEGWISALRLPSFQPESFFQHALGFNPLNQASSVEHLLQSLPVTPAVRPNPGPAPGGLQGIGPTAALPEAKPYPAGAKALRGLTGARPLVRQQPVRPLANQVKLNAIQNERLELAEKSRELIEIANQLEQRLKLHPQVDAPDILVLVRSFQKIIRQLDRDVSKIINVQSQHKQFEHKLLAQFSEKLQANLRFSRDRLDSLHGSGPERLKLLIDQSLIQLQAKIWLAQQNGSSNELQSALLALQG